MIKIQIASPIRLSNNISSLGSLLNTLRELPLMIDYIEVHTPDVKLGKANEGFFRVRSVIYGFSITFIRIS